MVEMTKKEASGTGGLLKKLVEYIGENNDIINPVIHNINTRLYPYMIIFSILFALLFIMVFSILCIVILQWKTAGAYIIPSSINTVKIVE
jgi:hypothetical protein